MSTMADPVTTRPAVLIVDEQGPRRQALLRLCETAGWLVQIVDAPPAPLEKRDLDSLEREHIQRVLSAHGGNVSQTARVLGVHRRTLQRKLRNERPAEPLALRSARFL
jgi:transcriptional regulator with GAF, ATPase, and Fis domain